MVVQNIKKLLKRSRIITNIWSWFIFFRDIPSREFLKTKKIKLIFIVKPYTMLSYSRLSKLYEIASCIEINKIKGNFVECGVWNGGSAGIIATIAKNNKSRHVWLFDSYEGQPVPSEYDISYSGSPAWKGMDLGYKEKVEELFFQKLKLDNTKIHLIKGWFTKSVPLYRKEVGRIALLHLDCDLYESVRLCLEELYDNVVRGGFIVIDDYGYWKGCKKAVDEFIQRRKLNAKLIKIDFTGVYFQKK